ncbi:MAG: L-threonylcarbamoyladenylate synthase [Bacteroidales bacterium]|nr:L-threonylcarbamoyladenylate synthase [Bacteroidales bacterium]
MIVKVYAENPSQKIIKKVVEVLKNDGVIVYPTDSLYAFGCDIFSHKAFEKIARLKNIDPEEAQFSLIFSNISQISEFTNPLSNEIFKLLKKNLPGPFTFIVEANNKVPKMLKLNKKKTIGIRIPNNKISLEIVNALGNPIFSTSVIAFDDIQEYMTDPELIHEKYKNDVDIVIDGGYGNLIPSTIVDCTGDKIEIIRQGAGELKF